MGSAAERLRPLKDLIDAADFDKIEALANVVKGCKQTLGRLIGAQDSGTGGTLYTQVETYLASYTNFPNLTTSQRDRSIAQLKQYLRTADDVSADAMKHNNTLATEISTLQVGEENDGSIQGLVDTQYRESIQLNKRLNAFYEKVGAHTARAGITLNYILDTNTEVQNRGRTVHQNSATRQSGKINTSIPGIPEKLDFNCTPSALALWFSRWGFWWGLAFDGAPNSNKLCNFIRTKLDDQWLRCLDDIDWTHIEAPQLQTIMDRKLEMCYPPLTRAINLLKDLKCANNETPSQFRDIIETSM